MKTLSFFPGQVYDRLRGSVNHHKLGSKTASEVKATSFGNCKLGPYDYALTSHPVAIAAALKQASALALMLGRSWCEGVRK